MSEILARASLRERTPEEISRQEDCAHEGAWDLSKNIFKPKADDKATFLFSCESKGAGACLQKQKSTCLWLSRELQRTC